MPVVNGSRGSTASRGTIRRISDMWKGYWHNGQMSLTNSEGHIFDLDGVLWKSNSLHKLAIETICRRHSLRVLPYESLAGRPTNEVFSLVLLANGSKSISLELISRLSKEKQSLFLELANSGKIEIQNNELLQEILKGKPAALVSGASLNTVQLYLKLLGSSPFKIVLTGQEFQAKPSPDGFLKAAKNLGLEPSACTVYEDSKSGLKAAKDGGFYYYHFFGDWSEQCQAEDSHDAKMLGCYKEMKDLIR